ncbi:ceramidase [Stachybotrys elegans]|uniref:Ceramidase n=1 Tax=Stachybotrys elegans TaxID=80388 RepID=A0A8K0WPV7_9HYPO|nr:ceramidase [Stachybotrys elegans]
MGHHNRHFAGDEHALSGVWSPPTSSANFCEEDYVVTRWIAEFINTLTNLMYVYFAVRQMAARNPRGQLALRPDTMSVSLLVLGVCSFLFHATLRQSMQFADELAMLGLAWAMLLGIISIGPASAYDAALKAGLALFFPAFSAFYVWSGQIIYHATAFMIILILITLRGYYLLYGPLAQLPEAKSKEWRARGTTALAVLVFGYALWHVDLECCAELRALRKSVGLPWAWLLEMHGWWHVLTAVSADMFMRNVKDVQKALKSE